MAAKKKPLPARKRVLHLESGAEGETALHNFFRSSTEWLEVRVDADPSNKPNYMGNMRDFSMVPDGSMEGVWIGQKLQLLYHHEVVGVLRECLRVLKTDGVMMLSVPNIAKVASDIMSDRLEVPLFKAGQGDVCSVDVIHGHRKILQKKGDAALHRMSYSANTIAGKLSQAGFRNIQVRIDNYILWVAGSKIQPDHPAYNQEPRILDYSNRNQEQADELNRAPMQWTPLNLKKKK